jgi:hypothetical protein
MIKIFLSEILCVICLAQTNLCIGQNNAINRTSTAIPGSDSAIFKERAMLKNYAFCRCIVQQAPNDSLLRHDGSLGGYVEIGSYNEKAYSTIDSFVSKQKFEKYRSKNKVPLSLMKCLDLYNSKELMNLILACDKYLHISRNYILWYLAKRRGWTIS